MKKTVVPFFCLIIAFIGVNMMSFKSIETNERYLTYKEGFYRARCTKKWSEKFTFTKGDREGQKAARKKANKAAKRHQEETGHGSGVLGPY